MKTVWWVLTIDGGKDFLHDQPKLFKTKRNAVNYLKAYNRVWERALKITPKKMKVNF